MSMGEAHEDMKSSRGWKSPMSPVNTVLVGVCVVGAVVCFVLGQTIAGTALLLGGIGGGIGAIFARRGTSGDLERVNSLEYADERDRAAAVNGLAAVGVVALILSAGQLIMHVIVDADPLSRWASIGVFLAPNSAVIAQIGVPGGGVLNLLVLTALLWCAAKVPGLMRRYVLQRGGNSIGSYLVRVLLVQQVARSVLPGRLGRTGTRIAVRGAR